MGAALVLAAIAGSVSAATGGAAADSTRAPSFDCSAYQSLLDDYLSVTSKPGAPLETRFDYTSLHDSKDRDMRLVVIRQQLLGVSPSRMEDRTRLAWAINAYNFLVIRTLVENLYDRPVWTRSGNQSVLIRRRFTSVKQVLLPVGFFDTPVAEIEGVEYTLNTFERRFVFAGYDPASKQPPPPSLDPRAPVARGWAAHGCPPRPKRGAPADSIDRQLESVTRGALSSPAHARWSAERGCLEASAIFDWYRADFGGREAAFTFIKRYVPPNLRALIEGGTFAGIGGTIPWDWSLNHTPDDGS